MPTDPFGNPDRVPNLGHAGRSDARCVLTRRATSPGHLGNSVCNTVRSGLDWIVGKVCISRGCLNLGMTEKLSYHRKPFSDQQSSTGEGM